MKRGQIGLLLTIGIVVFSFVATCMMVLTGCGGCNGQNETGEEQTPPTPQVEIGDVWDGEKAQVPTETDGVILIETAEELAGFSNAVNGGNSYIGKTIKLTKNLDLKNIAWEPIGNSTNEFQGIFDGDGHTICNLKVQKSGVNYVGLFGYTTNGEVKNLKVFNATVFGRLGVGVVSGCPYTTKYTSITVEGLVKVEGMSYVGGVVGRNAYANLTDITVNVTESSYVKAHSIEKIDGVDVAYRTYVGGVVGFMGEGGHEVKNVHSNIDVLGSTLDVGGITGIAHYNNKFINCSSSGDVKIYNAEKEENLEIGGIAGVWHNESNTSVTLTNCQFTGKLSVVYADGSSYTGEFNYSNLVGAPYNSTGTGKLIIGEQEFTAQDKKN